MIAWEVADASRDRDFMVVADFVLVYSRHVVDPALSLIPAHVVVFVAVGPIRTERIQAVVDPFPSLFELPRPDVLLHGPDADGELLFGVVALNQLVRLGLAYISAGYCVARAKDVLFDGVIGFSDDSPYSLNQAAHAIFSLLVTIDVVVDR